MEATSYVVDGYFLESPKALVSHRYFSVRAVCNSNVSHLCWYNCAFDDGAINAAAVEVAVIVTWLLHPKLYEGQAPAIYVSLFLIKVF